MFQPTKDFMRRVEGQNDRRPVRPETNSHRRFSLLPLLAWALVLSVTSLTLPGATHAQVLYGSLTGNVTDSAGAAVPGATVTALNTAPNLSKEATTNDEGICQSR